MTDKEPQQEWVIPAEDCGYDVGPISDGEGGYFTVCDNKNNKVGTCFYKNCPIKVVSPTIPKEEMEIVKAASVICYQLEQIPFHNFLHADRYNTDDKMTIHLWDDNGNSYDVTFPKGLFTRHNPAKGVPYTSPTTPQQTNASTTPPEIIKLIEERIKNANRYPARMGTIPSQGGKVVQPKRI